MNTHHDMMVLLQNTRMMSVQNMAAAMKTAPSDIFPLLDTLQQEGVLRMGGSVCKSSCTQCATDTCDVPKNAWSAESIVISLITEASV